MKSIIVLLLVLIMLYQVPALRRNKGRQYRRGAPKVTIFWEEKEEPVSFAVELTVTEEADKTYWVLAGFQNGQSGIQTESDIWNFKSMLFTLNNNDSNEPKYVKGHSDAWKQTSDFGDYVLNWKAWTKWKRNIADWQSQKKYIFVVKFIPAGNGQNIELHINKPEWGNKFELFGTFWEKKNPGDKVNPFSYIDDPKITNKQRSGRFKAFYQTKQGGNWLPYTQANVVKALPGPAKVEKVKDGDGDAISITTGAGSMGDKQRITLNPGKIPEPLLNFK